MNFSFSLSLSMCLAAVGQYPPCHYLFPIQKLFKWTPSERERESQDVRWLLNNSELCERAGVCRLSSPHHTALMALHGPQRLVGTAWTFPPLDSCFLKQPVQSMPGTGLCDWAQTVCLFDALPLISVCVSVCARKCQMTAGCEQRQINRTQYGQLADGRVYERVRGRPFAGTDYTSEAQLALVKSDILISSSQREIPDREDRKSVKEEREREGNVMKIFFMCLHLVNDDKREEDVLILIGGIDPTSDNGLASLCACLKCVRILLPVTINLGAQEPSQACSLLSYPSISPLFPPVSHLSISTLGRSDQGAPVILRQGPEHQR
ncbi:hypothetical protein QQF64_021161 [Cirrhinus molitorella]|uniref:FZ domain-containing protein n=1 Tax=Cirrhinus molitorella TaxID=172907 RepID=A0ABR3LDI2_9TELE